MRLRAILITLATLWGAPAAAEPCTVDADCDDGVECNGVETCGYDDQCRPGLGLCGPPTSLAGTVAEASSFYSSAYLPENAIDGLDASGSSWCSARNDPQPRIWVSWALEIEVAEIRVLTSWSPGYDFLSARFRLLDGAGAPLFETPPVPFTAGEVTVPVAPPVRGVRRLEMIGVTWRSNSPCLSEIEVTGSVSCQTDADCRFASPCVAVGVCAPSGNCAGAAPRCRNIALSHRSVAASSIFDQGFRAQRAVDGIDDEFHSWCAAKTDASPALHIELPNDHRVHGVTVSGPWPSYRFKTARVSLQDSQGTPTFDSGPVALTLGALALTIEPDGVIARHIDLEGLTFDAGPCVGELQLLGEYCGISVSGRNPVTIAFRPGTPVPEFELRSGLVSEMVADGGFDRAACLGRFSAEVVDLSVPDPPAGDATYILARAFNVCAAEGYGLSFVSPDPRAALAAAEGCAP